MFMYAGLIPFLVGLAGIALYAALRWYEVRRGRRFFDSARRHLDDVSVRLYRLAVFGELPSAYRTSFRKLLHTLTHTAVNTAVGLLRSVERPLFRLREKLRTSRIREGEPHDPSPFIRKITDAKVGNGENASDSVESQQSPP